MVKSPRQLVQQLPLAIFDEAETNSARDIDRLLPIEVADPSAQAPTFWWDIPHTISDLAYLTHNFYRYFGKFPPVIPRRLLQDYPIHKSGYVLDHMMGSGTTLVEAKLLGMNAIGTDLNPLGALAARVKSRPYNLRTLCQMYLDLRQILTEVFSFNDQSPNNSHLTELGRQCAIENRPAIRSLDKWYSEETVEQLSVLKFAILQLPMSLERELFTLAFLAVNRRTSLAFDGEVRPHVNSTKRPRPVLPAFFKKVEDMLHRMEQFTSLASKDTWIQVHCADARGISEVISNVAQTCELVITHPPYLNCFDYFPVYRLELLWSMGFPEVWDGLDYEALKRQEIRSWPATDPSLFEDYFAGLRDTFVPIRSLLAKGGRCCVVIGDCTIHKKLIPVHRMFADSMEELGFHLEKVVYRTTHYGIGKYAYMTRADYHGEEADKRDAVLVFRNN